MLFAEDYHVFLKQHARPGDFIYLDPPYMPISQYSDFKRYTKKQFRENDQHVLAQIETCLQAVTPLDRHPSPQELHRLRRQLIRPVAPQRGERRSADIKMLWSGERRAEARDPQDEGGPLAWAARRTGRRAW